MSSTRPRNVKQIKREELDKEWIALMFSAKKMGLTPDEIRGFFEKKNGKHAK